MPGLSTNKESDPVTQKVSIEMVNSAFEVRDTINELIDRGFDVTVKTSGAMVLITAPRVMEGEETETIH